MQRFEIEGIAIFRHVEPMLGCVSDENVVKLYNWYSNEMAAASWLSVTRKEAENFCKWVFESPFDKLFSEEC